MVNLSYRTIWGLIGIVFAAVVALVIIVPLIGNDDNNSASAVAGPWSGSHVLYEVPLVDGHNDLPNNLYEVERNLINTFDFDTDLKLNPKWKNVSASHTDLPRLRKGKVGGQFWVAYVDCKFTQNKDDVQRTLEQIDVIKRMIRKYPKDLKLVTEADGIMEAFKQQKIASMIGVEGGHSIDSRLAVLRMYYDLGVRYMTLTHVCNIPWADASPIDDKPEERKQNLTEWGEKVILEMNRLGMMVDLSHVSQGVMEDTLRVSKAPVIFSHSSSYTVFNHHRNVKDHVLRALKSNNGIIMVNFFSDFVGPNATIHTIIKHLNYIKSVIGPDHIGIGGDYDGVPRVPVGLEDVSKYPDLFDALSRTENGAIGWTREELKKLASLNLIRVMKAVEKVRDEMSNNVPEEKHITLADLVRNNVTDTCRSDWKLYNNTQEE